MKTQDYSKISVSKDPQSLYSMYNRTSVSLVSTTEMKSDYFNIQQGETAARF